MNNDYVAVKKEDLHALIGYVHTLFDFIDVEGFKDKKNVVLVNGGYDDFVKPIENILRDGNVVGDEILAKDVDIRQFKEQLSDIYDYDVDGITDKQLTELHSNVADIVAGDDDYNEIYNEAVHKVMSVFFEKATFSLEDKIKQADEMKGSCFDKPFINQPEKER